MNKQAENLLIAYPEYDKRIERDYMYDVKVVQGDRSVDLVCYNHCDSVITSPRTVNGDMYRRFCEFAFAGEPVRIEVTVYSDFDSYTVMPSAKNFRSSREGNVISIYLDKPDYLLFKLDASDDSILSIFADEPETDLPDKNDPNVIYVEGWYEPENSTVLNLERDNTVLYLAPGSVLNARVKVIGNGVIIKGRGMVLDPYSDIYKTDKSETVGRQDLRYLIHVTGDHCFIDGIKMVEARDFNLWVQCTDLTVTNLKILASEMCTDGITPHVGGGCSYKHCFIYVADNCLVLSASDETSVFDDMTLGSICCGIFPQNNAGKYEMSNFYLFRVDEGVMRNCYTWLDEPRSFDMTIDNLSAVDCHHFPFIFYGWNMGHLPKSITFNNLAVPVATGSEARNQGDGSTIRVENVKGRLETSNYTLNFNGLSVGGKAVTDQAELPKNMTDGNFIKVSGNGSDFGPTVSNIISGSVRPEGKLFIGERQLFTKNRPVKTDGGWLVPAEDVCAALESEVPATAVDLKGAKYISLDDLIAGGVAKSASYDGASGRINIAVKDGESGNLLSWFGNEAHSHWSEFISYNMHMVWLKEYGGNSFRMERCKKFAGISYNLTPQMQQYGKGTYTLTFSAKADIDTPMGFLFGSNREFSMPSIDITTEWQDFVLTFDEQTDPATIWNACLIMRAGTDDAGIEIRNAKLVYNG